MSRIGKLPIKLPQGVQVNISGNNIVKIKGPLGELEQYVNPAISVDVKDNLINVERKTEQKKHKSMHGLYRSLLSNMVTGVSKGYEIIQEIEGVGYKASANGQILELTLGYSHDIIFEIPMEVKVQTVAEKGKSQKIILKSIDKQLIGQIAAKIRSFRRPEPYKGKGIRFLNEQLRRKAGKTAAAATAS